MQLLAKFKIILYMRFLKLYVTFSNLELYHVLTYTPLLVLIQPNL